MTPFSASPKLFTTLWAIGTVLFILIAGYLVAYIAKSIIRWRGGSQTLQDKTFLGYFFASPWLIGFLIFVLGPSILSFYWSFTNYRIGSPVEWVGLKNYADLLQDNRFITAMFNSLYMTLIGVPLQLAAGLGMAMLLHQKIRGRTAFRAIFYLPVLLASSTAVLFTWRLMLNPNNGVVNTIFRWFNDTPVYYLNASFIFLTEFTSALLVALQTRNLTIVERIISNGFPGPERVPLWLGSEGLAFLWNKPSVVVIMMWSAGAMMLIYLAALSGVPQSLYEAAEVDGAGTWKKFRHITLPMIAPATFYNLVIGMIATLQIFEPAVTLVRDGGQNQSLYFAAYYLWRATFRFNEIGYGAAMSWVLLIIVLLMTFAQFKLANRWVYYENN
jgi:multiple sugar transport system permease protein